MHALLAFLFCAVSASCLSAAQYDWTGNMTGNYTWSTTSNWNSGTVPNSTTADAVFNNTGYVLNNATVRINVDSDITLFDIRVVGTAVGNSSLTFYGNTITINGTSGSKIQSTSTTLGTTIENNVVLASSNSTSISTGSSAGPLWFKGAISGSSPITIDGGSYLYLGGNNTFTGNVTFVGGGEVIATSTGAFSGANAGTYTLNSAASNSNFGSVASGTTTFSNAIDFNNRSSDMKIFTGNAGSTFDIATSAFSNTGGSGRILLERLPSATYIGYNATTAGTVKFSGTEFSMAKGVTSAGGNAKLELAPASGTQTWTGNFTGFSSTNSITKSGAGTVILGGTNTYTSQTYVNAGTLLINGTHIEATQGWGGAGAGVGIYEVASGGTLGGTGLISGNDTRALTNMVLVKNGGTIAPGGTSIGTLTLDGINIGNGTNTSHVLNMNDGSKFSFRLAGNGGTSDQIDFWNYASGDLLLGGNNTVNLTLSGAGDGGTHTVSLFKFYSGNGTSALFSGTNLTTGLTLGTLDPNISGTPTFSYFSDRIDLTYTSLVPEPATWVLVALAGTFLVTMRLRRRS